MNPVMRKFLQFLLAVVLPVLPARAVIFYNLGNSSNITDPGTGVPWDSIAKVTDASGTAIKGSAIYLGNGYMLTANHVDVNTSTMKYVTFSGTTTYAIDTTYFGGEITKQVEEGLDLKVFKLTTNPDVTAVNLMTTASEQIANSTTIGWGVGRNESSPLGSSSVTWGGDGSAQKRWGINVPKGIGDITYSADGFDYDEETVITVSGGSGPSYNPDGVGNDEAGITAYDSGSGLFQQISGTWYLIGVAVTTNQPAGTTLFGNDQISGSGDGGFNYYIRVSTYDEQIMAAIPEPATCGLLIGGGFAVIAAAMRARKTGPSRSAGV